jgi:hypothetical protein
MTAGRVHIEPPSVVREKNCGTRRLLHVRYAVPDR